MPQQEPITYSDNSDNKRQARDIDKHIGEQLKKFRKIHNLTQTKVGEKMGLSFQQVQKYEDGKSRLPLARAYDLSRFLEIDIETFFEGFGKDPQAQGLSDGAKQADLKSPGVVKNEKETEELQKAYFSIKDPARRSSFVKLVKEMAKNMQD